MRHWSKDLMNSISGAEKYGVDFVTFKSTKEEAGSGKRIAIMLSLPATFFNRFFLDIFRK